MRQDYNFFRDTATGFPLILRNHDTGQLLTPSDVQSISYSIYTVDSPLGNTETPVEGFIDVPIEIEGFLFDTLKTTQVQDRFGTRGMQYNFRFATAKQMADIEGVNTLVYPFPVRGNWYRVRITFNLNDASLPPLVVTIPGLCV